MTLTVCKKLFNFASFYLFELIHLTVPTPFGLLPQCDRAAPTTLRAKFPQGMHGDYASKMKAACAA